MEHDYAEILELLVEDRGLEQMGLSAEPVGRNRVWKISSADRGSEMFYVKIVRERSWYDREVRGLKIAGVLAERHDWITAPPLLYQDAERLAIVIGAIPGESGTSLIRRAYRMDKNPLRRRKAITPFLDGVRHAVEWLRLLHAHEYEEFEGLVDHRASSVAQRVVRKLERAVRATSLSIDSGKIDRLGSLGSAYPRGPASLICGDASLGNFFWDGERIGRIDFEDLGVGPAGRDFNTIRLYVSRITDLPWYWSDDEVESIVPDGEEGWEGALHTLEWKLDYHWGAHQRSSMRATGRLGGDISSLVDALIEQYAGRDGVGG